MVNTSAFRPEDWTVRLWEDSRQVLKGCQGQTAERNRPTPEATRPAGVAARLGRLSCGTVRALRTSADGTTPRGGHEAERGEPEQHAPDVAERPPEPSGHGDRHQHDAPQAKPNAVIVSVNEPWSKSAEN